jgi:hypothetical protein
MDMVRPEESGAIVNCEATSRAESVPQKSVGRPPKSSVDS